MINTTNSLILIAIIAWILQLLLGWWQVSRFNKAFSLLCQQGNVGIGRSKGRFKPKVVIAVAFDQNNRVVNSFIIKGFSVFSAPQTITSLQGLLHSEIIPERFFPHSKASQDALEEAIRLQ
ncbi:MULTISPECIES: transcriptional regulator GutM [Rodentibacter]|uniref:transcriptional regulator GutM n=1 Tax=Rodentibacter TaxID=1960084 RepID=UPI001CFD17AD|nr:transcriptional regulator GutM [Rodentibacter sp. JRC1]GJI56609.1 transcriptional regulator GutM [Rodentibacter sp. JRC1]